MMMRIIKVILRSLLGLLSLQLPIKHLKLEMEKLSNLQIKTAHQNLRIQTKNKVNWLFLNTNLDKLLKHSICCLAIKSKKIQDQINLVETKCKLNQIYNIELKLHLKQYRSNTINRNLNQLSLNQNQVLQINIGNFKEIIDRAI